jgi:hypothetical protein
MVASLLSGLLSGLLSSMPTPQINIRVPAQYHDLMRRIAVTLRENASTAAAFAALCDGAALPESRLESRSESSRLDILEARVRDLESRIPEPKPKRYLRRGQNTKAIPDETLTEAQRLKDEGKPLREILDILDLDATEGGLKNALWKRRHGRG